MTANPILAQLDTHPRVVELNVTLATLAQTIREFEETVIELAQLTGNNDYLGFTVTKADGRMTVTATPDAIRLLQPPPVKPVAVIEVKPVIVPRVDHIALLTGTVARFEAAIEQAEQYQLEGVTP